MKTSVIALAAGIAASVLAQDVPNYCDNCGQLDTRLPVCSAAWRGAVENCMAAPCNFRYAGDPFSRCSSSSAGGASPSSSAMTIQTSTPGATTVTPGGSVSSSVLSSASSALSSISSALSSVTSGVSSNLQPTTLVPVAPSVTTITNGSSIITSTIAPGSGSSSSTRSGAASTTRSGSATVTSVSTTASGTSTTTEAGSTTTSTSTTSSTSNGGSSIAPRFILESMMFVAGWLLL